MQSNYILEWSGWQVKKIEDENGNAAVLQK